MKLSTALLALTATLTSALPSPQAPAFPLPPADTIYYYFRSSVLPDQGNRTKYDSLYMVAYHTGAGLSAATFQSAPLNSHRGWFNGTQLRWFEPTTANDAVFGVAWGSGTSYDLWYPVSTCIPSFSPSNIVALVLTKSLTDRDQRRIRHRRFQTRRQ